jgi:hypothetical protein
LLLNFYDLYTFFFQLEGLRAITAGLKRLLQAPLLSASSENGSMDMDGDSQEASAIRVKLSITVWDFVLPVTPSLPAVFGVSFHI